MNEAYKYDLPIYLTIPEMGDLLRISRSGAYALTNIPGFPLTRLGKRKMVKTSDLFAWLEHQNNPLSV